MNDSNADSASQCGIERGLLDHLLSEAQLYYDSTSYK